MPIYRGFGGGLKPENQGRKALRFAAIAPLRGLNPDPRWGSPLVRMPVRAFHGTDDHVANPSDTEIMIENLQKLGGDPRFTPLVGEGHEISAVVYNRADLYA